LTGGGRKDQEQGEQCVGNLGMCQGRHDRRGRERHGSEKIRADNASTMKAPGSLSSVIDAAGSYPAYQNARQLSDMLFTAGA
jgi:hypothetical protein